MPWPVQLAQHQQQDGTPCPPGTHPATVPENPVSKPRCLGPRTHRLPIILLLQPFPGLGKPLNQALAAAMCCSLGLAGSTEPHHLLCTETHRGSGTQDALPARGHGTWGHPAQGSKQRSAVPAGSTELCFTQPGWEQEWTEFGMSLNSSCIPISNWQCYQLHAGPAQENRLGNTTRMFANDRLRTVTHKGAQGPKTPGRVGSTRKHTSGSTCNSTHTPAGPPCSPATTKPLGQQQHQHLLESDRKPSFADSGPDRPST